MWQIAVPFDPQGAGVAGRMHEVNQVEFRRLNEVARYSEPQRDVVEVLIDRRSLVDIVAGSTQGRAGGRWLPAEWLFRQGHRIWMGEPASSPDLVHADGVSVLRCVDGLAECGGVSARIELAGTQVISKTLGRCQVATPLTWDRSNSVASSTRLR
jgi:hypothetical protein